MADFRGKARASWRGVRRSPRWGSRSNERAAEIVRRLRGQRLDFDYVGGRPLKIDITDNMFDEWLFDRDAGQGAAKQAIDTLRA